MRSYVSTITFVIITIMDKLTVISGTLFMAADVFAIVSLAMPDWIITDVGGTYLMIFKNTLSSAISCKMFEVSF